MLGSTVRVFLALGTILLLVSCKHPHDPEDPVVPKDGVLSGTAVIFDEHLLPVADRSGVIVQLRNTDGLTLRDTTDSQGYWEVYAPFGVYALDTIYCPGMVRLHIGYGNDFHPMKTLDWLGKGSRVLLTETAFCPPELQEIVQVDSISNVLDSTFTPQYIDTLRNDTIPARYWLQFVSNVYLHSYPYNTPTITASMRLPGGNNKPLTAGHAYLSDQGHGQLAAAYTGKEEIPWDSWKGAEVTMLITSKVVREIYERHADGTFTQRWVEVPSQPTELTYQGVP